MNCNIKQGEMVNRYEYLCMHFKGASNLFSINFLSTESPKGRSLPSAILHGDRKKPADGLHPHTREALEDQTVRYK